MSLAKSLSLSLSCLACVAQAAPIEEQRAIGTFQRLRVEGSVDVRVTPGPARTTVLGEQTAVREVRTELDGDTLVIRQTDAFPRRSAQVTVQIQAPTLSALDLRGSADVRLQDFNLPALTLRVAGSGDVEGQAISIGRLELKLAGSGDIRLSGRCEQAAMSVAGSGNVTASEFNCRDVSVSVAGSGDAAVRATERVSASVAGSGDVRYSGRPAQVQRQVAGSGTVSSVD